MRKQAEAYKGTETKLLLMRLEHFIVAGAMFLYVLTFINEFCIKRATVCTAYFVLLCVHIFGGTWLSVFLFKMKKT